MAKKATKRAATKVNKTQVIKDYLATNPGAANQVVAAALNKRGVDVTANYVSTIKTNMKNKGKKKAPAAKKAAAKKRIAVKSKAPAKKKQAAGDDVSLSVLLAAKELAAKLGGIERAKQAINAWALLSK